MRRTWTVLLAPLAFSAGTAAQAVSTATATQPLVVNSSVTGSQTFAPGPVPTALTLNTPGMSSIWSKMSLSQFPSTGFPGMTGWSLNGRVNVGLSFFGSGTASLSGQVRLHFSSPQPVSGLLYMRPYFADGFPVSSGDITVDLDCDGTPDYAASTRGEQGVEIPMSLDATGRVICVDMNISGSLSNTSWNPVSAGASASWQIVFLPGTYGLERHRTGCHPISFGRHFQYGWRAAVGCSVSGNAPPITLGFMLVGLGAQNAPLSLPPYCPLLVANPAVVVPDWLYGTSMGFFPPDLIVPPGVRFYCQGTWLDAQGNVFTSDSIRTF